MKSTTNLKSSSTQHLSQLFAPCGLPRSPPPYRVPDTLHQTHLETNTEELIASVITAINTTKNWQKMLDNHRFESRRLIMNVMRQNSEMGLMSQFLQNCNSAQDAEKIAALIVSVLNEIGLESVWQIRILKHIFTEAKEGRSLADSTLNCKF